MRKSPFNRYLVGILLCLSVLLGLQAYWIGYAIRLQQTTFNKTINQVLVNSAEEKMNQQSDSMAKALFTWLMDTSLTEIYSAPHPWPEQKDIMQYFVRDKKPFRRQQMNFSIKGENRPILGDTSIVKQLVARRVVENLRGYYRKSQVIYYYTKTTGDSAAALADRLKIDTSVITRIYRKQLVNAGITTPFRTYFVDAVDSATLRSLQNKAHSFSSLQTQPSLSGIYTAKDTPLYVYAVFNKPWSWMFSKLVLPLVVALLVLLLVSGLLFFLYRTIRQQKLLSVIKNDFIDNMTHELKTPIATISAAAEAIQHFGSSDNTERTEKYLVAIREQAGQLNNIVNKVLDTAHFENQEVSLKRSNFSLTAMLLEIKESKTIAAEEGRLELEILGPDLYYYGDRFHLKNVFFNLIDNAVKYNDKEKARVVLRLEMHKEVVQVRVEDNGPGIPAAALPHIFEKFYRLPQGNIQRVKGFGLGLFYVKKIVTLHSGSIHVVTVPGTMTAFIIELPKFHKEKEPS